MKSKPLNLLSELVPVLFFSLAVYILFEPWLYHLLRSSGRLQLLNFLPVWSISVMGLSAFLGKWLAKLDDRYRFISLFAYIAANLLVLYLLGWPLSIYLPLTLVLVLFGLRFRSYYTTGKVKTDIGLGVLFLFFNLTMSTKTAFTVGYSEIILFFIAAISVGVFFNLRSLKDEGFNPQYRLSFLILSVSAGVIFFAAFLIGMPLEGSLIPAFLGIVRRIYLFFVDLFTLLLYALVWILRPLFNLIGNLEFAKPEQSPRRDGLTGQLDDIKEGVTGAEGIESPIGPYILWGLLCLVLILLLIWLTKKLWDNWEENRAEEGVTQENESIFSISELAARAKNSWFSLRNGLSRFRGVRPRDRYKGEDPLTRIRWTYFRFARKLQNFLSFRASNTPRDYLKRLSVKLDQDDIEPDLSELTEIYNRARYGNQAAAEDADRARNLWERIVEKMEENED